MTDIKEYLNDLERSVDSFENDFDFIDGAGHAIECLQEVSNDHKALLREIETLEGEINFMKLTDEAKAFIEGVQWAIDTTKDELKKSIT